MILDNKQQSIKIEDFNYNLPDEKIAKYPLVERDKSKLLHFDNKNITERQFFELPQLLDKQDFIVFNNTKVIQARLFFEKPSGAKIEIFVLEPSCPADYQLAFQSTQKCKWKVMIGNAKRWKSDVLSKDLQIGGHFCTFSATRKMQLENMTYIVDFEWDNPEITFGQILQHLGELPIPPYLNRKTEQSDKKTYQTVYAQIDGSVAAPTAGLHFTPQVLKNLAEKGIQNAKITLHVGAGTFQPVKAEHIGEHTMHAEFFEVQLHVIEQLIEHLDNVVAVGTTSVRTLESLYYIGCHIKQNPLNPQFSVSQWEAYKNDFTLTTTDALNEIVNYMKINKLEAINAHTQIIIVPSFKFRIVKKIITNFHQPKSTLLLLVSAFTGIDECRKIYDFALNHNFRFLSYGDSSLLELRKSI